MQPMQHPGVCPTRRGGFPGMDLGRPRRTRIASVPDTIPVSPYTSANRAPSTRETSHAAKRCTAMALAGSIHGPHHCTSLGNADRTRLVSRSTVCPGPVQAHHRIRTPVGTWHAAALALLWGWAPAQTSPGWVLAGSVTVVWSVLG
jgi:hypothetical protein